MQIVLVAPFGLAPKNTTRRRVLPIARALAARGADVQVVVPPYDDPGNFGRAWTDHEVRVTCLPRPPLYAVPGLGAALAQLTLARGIVRAVGRANPDIVHVFKPKAVSGLAQARLARARRRPLVLDTDDWEGQAGWSAYEDYPRWLARVFDWQERVGLRRTSAVTAASRRLMERAETAAPLRPVIHLPNGFDPAAYAAWGTLPTRDAARARWSFATTDRVALVYTRFFEYSVAAWTEVIQGLARADADVRFLVVGAGKFGQERDLSQAVSAAGLAAHVRFTGWLPFDQLPAALAAGDVGLMPMHDVLANQSKCSVRYIDLMHAGVPIVATPVGEATTYVRDAQTGYVAAGDQPAAVVAATQRALADAGRAHVIERARARAHHDLSWKTLIDPLLDLYGRVGRTR